MLNFILSLLLFGNVFSCNSLLQMLVRGSSVGGKPHLRTPTLNGFRCDDIDNLVTKFPPCMRHLHNSLRQRHRLKHMSRVRPGLWAFMKLKTIKSNILLLDHTRCIGCVRTPCEQNTQYYFGRDFSMIYTWKLPNRVYHNASNTRWPKVLWVRAVLVLRFSTRNVFGRSHLLWAWEQSL